MSIHQHATLADTVYFWFGSNDTAGSGNDGSTPVYDVRLAGAAAGAAPVLSGSGTLLSHADYPAGCHEVAIAATAGNGFAAGNTYAVFCTLLVDSENPTGFVGSFTLGPIVADLIEMGGVAQSATDLKDFADAGYDPATNKVQGVVLTDTCTTLTGHTAQTGDNYARLGAPAGASISADIADVPTVAEFNARTLVAADYFDPAADTVANVTTVATLTGHTAQTGDSYARLGAPAGASVSADIADIPTVAEFNARTLVAASYFDPTTDDVTLANGAHGGAAASITLADYSDFQGAGGDPWATAIPGAYGAGTAGYILGTNLDAVLTARTLATASYFDPTTDDVTLANGAHGGAAASITLADYSDFQGAGGDPWATNIPGAYGAGTAGYILGTNLDAVLTARTLAAAAYFDPTADTVANVTLVATTTTNTDMRGTDNAALASVCTEGRLSELDPANIPTDLSVIGTAVTTTIPTQINTVHGVTDGLIGGLNDPTAAAISAQVWTEAGQIDGKTPTEALQIIAATTAGELSGAGSGTEVFVGLDGLTTRVTVTLDGSNNRTGIVYG